MKNPNITSDSKLTRGRRIFIGICIVILSTGVLWIMHDSIARGHGVFESFMPHIFLSLLILYLFWMAFFGHIQESLRRGQFTLMCGLCSYLVGVIFSLAFFTSIIFGRTIFSLKAFGPIIGHYTFIGILFLILGAVGGYIYARLHPDKYPPPSLFPDGKQTPK